MQNGKQISPVLGPPLSSARTATPGSGAPHGSVLRQQSGPFVVMQEMKVNRHGARFAAAAVPSSTEARQRPAPVVAPQATALPLGPGASLHAPMPSPTTVPGATTEQMEAVRMKQVPHELLCKMLGRSAEEASKAVQVISLGNNCGIKLSIRRLGLDKATMPLDWIRSSVDGLIHWLETNFQDFMDTEHLEHFDIVMRDKAMTVYRSPAHSFWHDNLDDPQVQRKLQRRIDRFMDLANDPGFTQPRPILFVRSICGSSELGRTEELYQLLRKRFETKGRKVYLLAILEDQPVSGPLFHAAYGGALIYWVQPLFSGPLTLDGDSPAPCEDAIAFAVQRVLLQFGLPEPGSCAGDYPIVGSSKDLLDPKQGLQATEAGKWVGYVTLQGATDKIKFAAFTGIDGYLGTEALNPWLDEEDTMCEAFCNPSHMALGNLTLLNSCRVPAVTRKSEIMV